jgi:hypothetical protein
MSVLERARAAAKAEAKMEEVSDFDKLRKYVEDEKPSRNVRVVVRMRVLELEDVERGCYIHLVQNPGSSQDYEEFAVLVKGMSALSRRDFIFRVTAWGVKKDELPFKVGDMPELRGVYGLQLWNKNLCGCISRSDLAP